MKIPEQIEEALNKIKEHGVNPTSLGRLVEAIYANPPVPERVDCTCKGVPRHADIRETDMIAMDNRMCPVHGKGGVVPEPVAPLVDGAWYECSDGEIRNATQPENIKPYFRVGHNETFNADSSPSKYSTEYGRKPPFTILRRVYVSDNEHAGWFCAKCHAPYKTGCAHSNILGAAFVQEKPKETGQAPDPIEAVLKALDSAKPLEIRGIDVMITELHPKQIDGLKALAAAYIAEQRGEVYLASIRKATALRLFRESAQ